MFNIIFYEKRAVYEKMWQNIAKRDWPDDITAHSHCMLNTYGYRHTLRICNTYCVFTAKMIAQKRLSVTSTFIVFMVA